MSVEVEQAAQAGQTGPANDRWNHWVMSLQGQVAMSGEESSRELNLSADLGADRITDDWKITMGFDIEYQREDFDLDEDDPLRAVRKERDFDGLIARSLNDHWSIGGRTSIGSSSFENIAFQLFGGPAIEYNLFPYSQYTRRQLRLGYAVGPYRARYVEETLFFKLSETLAQQQATVTTRPTRAMGIPAGRARILHVSPAALALPYPARRRRERQAGTRLVAVAGGIDEPDPRSALHSAARRDI